MRRLLGSLAVLFLLTGTGCVPGVTWLPDSSGLVFTSSDKQLLLYDVQKRAKRVLVANTKTSTIWPAVSPDGRRVAVARFLTNNDSPDTIEILIHDLEGKEVQRSSTFTWGPGSASSNQQVSETFLFWSPRSEHVVVMAGARTGLYDVRNDGLIILDDALPFVVNSTPFRPDGEGFLISRKKEEAGLTYHFVNWEGREYNLAMKPLPPGDDEWARFPLIFDAGWEGNTAVVRRANATLRLDAGKYRGEYRGEPLAENAMVEEVRQQAVFANGSCLRVIWVRDLGNQREFSYRVEVLDRTDGKPRVVVDRLGNCLVFPSPDRKLVALRGTPKGKGDRIIVIDDRGEVVAEVVPGA